MSWLSICCLLRGQKHISKSRASLSGSYAQETGIFLYCWIKTSHTSTTACLIFLIPTPPHLRASSHLECLIQWAGLPAAGLLEDSSLHFIDWDQNLIFECVSQAIPLCCSNIVRQPQAVCVTGILSALVCSERWNSLLCSFCCLLFLCLSAFLPPVGDGIVLLRA